MGNIISWGEVPQSLRAGRSRDRILVKAPIRMTVPGVHPTSYTMGTGYFSGDEAVGNAEVITYTNHSPSHSLI